MLTLPPPACAQALRRRSIFAGEARGADKWSMNSTQQHRATTHPVFFSSCRDPASMLKQDSILKHHLRSFGSGAQPQQLDLYIAWLVI
jgi:hypothetical protein